MVSCFDVRGAFVEVRGGLVVAVSSSTWGVLGSHPQDLIFKLTPISCNLRHSLVVMMTFKAIFT